MVLPTKVLLSILPFFLQATLVTSQSTGKTTRYWDCCKASCGWTKKISLASGANPVASCDKSDNKLSNYDAKSGCDGGGPAYMCSNQSPWAVSDSLAYGYAAATISGGNENSWCCGCYELTFTSGPVSGKKMVVQVTNTGGDLGSNQFDLAIPGGGFGIFNGCTAEWGTPSTGWGKQYGGVDSRAACDAFPAALKQGCYWRFDWFGGADNPAMTFKKVTCPAALTSKSGCVRQGETPSGAASSPTWTKGGAVATGGMGSAPSATNSAASTGSNAGSDGTAVAQYGQCGGTGYTGSTACASGFTCTATNEYYSQCL